MGRSNFFARFAQSVAFAVGHPFAFGAAILTIIAWGVVGPMFHYSDSWQLVINTGTTIITFLMVFLIQHTQNRESHATQIKLDELIRVTEGAHNALMCLEELSDFEIDALRRRYNRLAEEAREAMRGGGKDTGSPPVETDVERSSDR
jgi:low affinity Fe/Cu permease